MKVLAWLLLLAASTGRQIINQEDVIPAGDWKFYDVPVHDQAARIAASFDVLNGSDKVRASLMLREHLDRLNGDVADGAILQTGEGRHGGFSDSLRRQGDYVVVVDNEDGQAPATVHLRIWLDFTPSKTSEVSRLPARRQLVVVLLSCAVFFGIVGMSARKLLRAIRR